VVKSVVVGAQLVNTCPQCASPVTPGLYYCNQCGQDLTVEVIRRVVGLTSHEKRDFPIKQTVAAGAAIALILVSLALPWYAVRLPDLTLDYSATDLIIRTAPSWAEWAGLALPLIMLILFASIALLSVIYSLWSNQPTRALWAILGALSAFCVLFSALYFLWWVWDNPLYSQWVNIIHGGSVAAFAGSLILTLSAIPTRKRRQVEAQPVYEPLKS
jgi:hypothetical protein